MFNKSRMYESSIFWIKLQKKTTSHDILMYLDSPVHVLYKCM